jgi:hypothetical protein
MISQYGIVTPTSLDLSHRDPYLETKGDRSHKEQTQTIIEGKHQHAKPGPMWLANPKAPGLAFTPERYSIESRKS